MTTKQSKKLANQQPKLSTVTLNQPTFNALYGSLFQGSYGIPREKVNEIANNIHSDYDADGRLLNKEEREERAQLYSLNIALLILGITPKIDNLHKDRIAGTGQKIRLTKYNAITMNVQSAVVDDKTDEIKEHTESSTSLETWLSLPLWEEPTAVEEESTDIDETEKVNC